MSLRIEQYRPELENEWNSFLSSARNDLFLFKRSFMDYHSDRFVDNSMMAYRNNKLVAVLPANVSDDILHSHQGLTFGGWVINDSVGAQHMLDIFSALIEKLKDSSYIRKIIYKKVPFIFSRQCSEEDSYALMRLGAKIIRRDLNSVVSLTHPIPIDSSRKDNLRKAKKLSIEVRYSDEFETYFEILHEALGRHGVNPVHSPAEIKLLRDRHPNNVKLLASYQRERMLAGAILFDYGDVIHTQYMASSADGRSFGALDAVINTLREEMIGQKHFLSFGISTEDQGRTLNEGLLRQKEGFGARSIVHDFYEVSF